MRESKTETDTCDYARADGWLVYKFTSPGRRGVPDRLFLRDKIIFFIEFKAPDKPLRKLQEKVKRDIEKQGFDVYVVDNFEYGKNIIDSYKKDMYKDSQSLYDNDVLTVKDNKFNLTLKESIMSISTDIIEIAKTIKPSDSKTEVKLMSWPYSRNFVKAVCEALGIEYEYERVSKQHDLFKIASDGVDAKIKKMLRLINKEAKTHEKPTKARNDIVVDLESDLFENQEEIQNAEVAEEAAPAEDTTDDFLEEDEPQEEPQAPKKTKKKSSKKKVSRKK